VLTPDKIEREAVTAIRAEAYLASNTFEKQRRLNPRHVKYLVDEMRKNRFVGGDLRLACLNGTTVLVNGQHTLHAIIESGLAQECAIYSYRVDGPKELEDLFALVDAGRGRTTNDVLKALGYFDMFQGVSRLVLQSAQSGLGMIDNEGRFVGTSSYTSKLERAKRAMGQSALIKFIAAVNERSDPPGLIRQAGFSAAMGATFKQNQNKAREFWYGVAQGGLDKADPRMRLRTFALEVKRGSGSQAYSIVFRHCMDAWIKVRT